MQWKMGSALPRSRYTVSFHNSNARTRSSQSRGLGAKRGDWHDRCIARGRGTEQENARTTGLGALPSASPPGPRPGEGEGVAAGKLGSGAARDRKREVEADARGGLRRSSPPERRRPAANPTRPRGDLPLSATASARRSIAVGHPALAPALPPCDRRADVASPRAWDSLLHRLARARDGGVERDRSRASAPARKGGSARGARGSARGAAPRAWRRSRARSPRPTSPCTRPRSSRSWAWPGRSPSRSRMRACKCSRSAPG